MRGIVFSDFSESITLMLKFNPGMLSAPSSLVPLDLPDMLVPNPLINESKIIIKLLRSSKNVNLFYDIFSTIWFYTKNAAKVRVSDPRYWEVRNLRGARYLRFAPIALQIWEVAHQGKRNRRKKLILSFSIFQYEILIFR